MEAWVVQAEEGEKYPRWVREVGKLVWVSDGQEWMKDGDLGEEQDEAAVLLV